MHMESSGSSFPSPIGLHFPSVFDRQQRWHVSFSINSYYMNIFVAWKTSFTQTGWEFRGVEMAGGFAFAVNAFSFIVTFAAIFKNCWFWTGFTYSTKSLVLFRQYDMTISTCKRKHFCICQNFLLDIFGLLKQLGNHLCSIQNCMVNNVRLV